MSTLKVFHCFLTVIFTSTAIIIDAQTLDTFSFKNIKHTPQIQYIDKASSKVFGGHDSSNYFAEIYLLPGHCSIDKKKKEVKLEAFVWTIHGISRNQSIDTLPLENFEVFLATPYNEELIDRRVLTTRCLTPKHDNGFMITFRLKERDRLYITNCSNEFLQEWNIGELLK